jgi:tryptophan synthase beta chain
VPPQIHSGGLRYHGMASIICELYDQKLIEAQAVNQTDIFASAVTFARAEGIIPAPEPSHAIKVVIDEALRCRESGEAKVILFNLCGHGHFDLSAYESYLDGRLEDYAYPEAMVHEAMTHLPVVG